MIEFRAISWLTCCPELQMREGLNEERVQAYVEAIQAADGEWPFPPIEVVDTFVVDGWHRLEAARRCGLKEVPTINRGKDLPPEADRHQAALIFACGANAKHGLPRTNGDKLKAVRTLLDILPGESNRKIAGLANVSHTYVRMVRNELAEKETCGNVSTAIEQKRALPLQPDVVPSADKCNETAANAKKEVARALSPVAQETDASCKHVTNAQQDNGADKKHSGSNDPMSTTKSVGGVASAPAAGKLSNRKTKDPDTWSPAELSYACLCELAHLNKLFYVLKKHILFQDDFKEARGHMVALDCKFSEWVEHFRKKETSSDNSQLKRAED